MAFKCRRRANRRHMSSWTCKVSHVNIAFGASLNTIQRPWSQLWIGLTCMSTTMRNSTNITTLISNNNVTSIHHYITTTKVVTNNASSIRNVTNYFTGSNITNSLTNAGNITKSLLTNTTNFHALPTIPAPCSITWIIG